MEQRYGKIRILEEKTMGRSRADIVMVMPDKIAGIEIKSDADTYARLSRQVKDYDLYFDCNYVVVGSTHAAHIREHVPQWWGIISVELWEDKVDFYVIREAGENPNMKPERKITILWRPELSHIQQINGMAKYGNKSKKFVQNKILEQVPSDLLKKQICQELFERDYTLIQETIRQYRKNN